jgi:UDP-N-acetylmuramoylalanine--D-glutamate ligase
VNTPLTSGRFDQSDRVLVIGLGRSGRASVAVLQPRVAALYATDESPPENLAPVLAELEAAGVPFVAPADLAEVFPKVTVAVLSPGIPLNGELVRRIQAAGIPVFSEVEVAYRICKAPIVALTGTKGKSTTTALIGAIFRAAGKTTYVGGNIGNALIHETAIAKPDDWVQAARVVHSQYHPRSSRPLSLDGRVCRSEVSHLRQSRTGRYVRGQP